MPASHAEAPLTNGHDDLSHPSSTPKKAPSKSRKAAPKTQDEASRLLQARINQLEQDDAAERDSALEIEREVKRADRDLRQNVSKMDTLQKIDYLHKKSSELLADMRRMDKENQKNKRRGDSLQKERDNSRTELSKTVSLKEKLEKLCRELQRDNNKMKNENKELQTTQKRKDTSWDDKYSSLLSKLENYQEDKDTPKKQVVDMKMEELFTSRFKSFIDQYELRELHFHSLMRTKELEVQHHMARFEREKKNAEAEATKARQLQSQVQAFTRTEAELRNQLNVYVDKFKQVEDTLNNSNDLFLSFRKEMEDMSKKSKQLEKDNALLKRQKDATSENVLRLAEERQEYQSRIKSADKKAERLMSIIKGMQDQGRAVPPNMASMLDKYSSENPQADEDSEYSDEGEEEEPSDLDEDEDTEDDPATSEVSMPVYGPERPPQQQQQQPLQNGQH